jgi:hypothetical protein
MKRQLPVWVHNSTSPHLLALHAEGGYGVDDGVEVEGRQVCVCVFVCVCLYVFVCVYMLYVICVYVYMCICVYVYMCVHNNNNL